MKGSIEVRHGRWYIIETTAGEACVQHSGDNHPGGGCTLIGLAAGVYGSAEADGKIQSVKLASGWCFRIHRGDTETLWHGPHQTSAAARSEAEALCKILDVEVDEG